jgi:drug/metabolite transporter (DMT)-like permease
MTSTRLFSLTLMAMIAFAGNSLLCRLALKQTRSDAASFTLVRIVSGAIVLGLIASLRRGSLRQSGSWVSAAMLFVYAAGFSFAYLTLSAGTGALLLFGAVQATMIFWALRSGERLDWPQRLGLALALAGLVALVLPGLSAPPFRGSLLMFTAGVAWGVYSLRGKKVGDPLLATAGNFARAVPMAALLSLFSLPHLDRTGTVCAILSGAIASGVGYAIWYTALPGLKSASAASVQLVVPVLAAVGGILLLGEAITLRLVLASVAVLGGIWLVVGKKNRKPA